MTISELVEQYKPKQTDSTLTRMRKMFSWRTLLANADKDKMKWFFDLLELGSYIRYPDPETFLSLLHDLGIDVDKVDLNVFLDKVESIGDLGIRLNHLPTFPKDLYLKYKHQLKEINQTELAEFLESIDWIGKHAKRIYYGDHSYFVGNLDAFYDIKDDYVAYHFPYLQLRRDCDDFALLFKAFLSRNGLGNFAAGIMWAAFADPDTNRYMGHAINLIVYESENGKLDILLYEPQSENHFYKKGSTKEEWEKIDPYLIVF